MNPVIIRNVTIGEGIPKICVPIVGVSREEIVEEAKLITETEADLAEWRADWYEDVFDFDKVTGVLNELREILCDMPILFTFRTAKEGGEKSIETEVYRALNQAVIMSGNADLVDVELFVGDEVISTLTQFAHEKGVKVIASNHDFEKTPPKEEIIKRLQKMQSLEADILKIAVMPQRKEDVQTLLSATREMSSKYAKKPIVTMSMGELGVVSRIEGEIYGSSITFGTAKKASAPGQIPVEELKKLMKKVHESR